MNSLTQKSVPNRPSTSVPYEENPIHVTLLIFTSDQQLSTPASQFIQLPLSTTTKAASAAALPLPSLPSALPNPTVPPTGVLDIH